MTRRISDRPGRGPGCNGRASNHSRPRRRAAQTRSNPERHAPSAPRLTGRPCPGRPFSSHPSVNNTAAGKRQEWGRDSHGKRPVAGRNRHSCFWTDAIGQDSKLQSASGRRLNAASSPPRGLSAPARCRASTRSGLRPPKQMPTRKPAASGVRAARGPNGGRGACLHISQQVSLSDANHKSSH
jgi:hypothetical protein